MSRQRATYTGHRTYRRNRARLQRITNTCALCGQPIPEGLPPHHPDSFTADHKVPVSKGGTHALSNLQASHSRCNLRRGNRDRIPGTPDNLGRTW